MILKFPRDPPGAVPSPLGPRPGDVYPHPPAASLNSGPFNLLPLACLGTLRTLVVVRNILQWISIAWNPYCKAPNLWSPIYLACNAPCKALDVQSSLWTKEDGSGYPSIHGTSSLPPSPRRWPRLAPRGSRASTASIGREGFNRSTPQKSVVGRERGNRPEPFHPNTLLHSSSPNNLPTIILVCTPQD